MKVIRKCYLLQEKIQREKKQRQTKVFADEKVT